MRSPAEAGGVLAVAGDLVEDVVVWAAEPLRAATDTAARVFRARGGSGANVAALAAALVPTRFIGRVGADAAGAGLADDLAAAGVDVRVQRAGRTGTVVLLVDAEGERTMFPDRGASAELADVDPAWLDGVAWLHLPAYGLEREPMRSELARLAASARQRGAAVSMDASSTGLLAGLGVGYALDLIRAIAPDVLFANEDEASLLGIAGGGEVAASAAPTVIVKHGPLPTDVRRGGRARRACRRGAGARHPRPHGRRRRVRRRIPRRDARRGGCRDGLPRGARERGIRARAPRRARVVGRRGGASVNLN